MLPSKSKCDSMNYYYICFQRVINKKFNDTRIKNKIGIMFPGQGFQYVGMLNEFISPLNEDYQKIIKEFDDILCVTIKENIYFEENSLALLKNRLDLSNFMTLEKEDSEEVVREKRKILNLTKVAQPAILLHSLLNFKKFLLESSSYQIISMFGPSLGEIIAMVCAGSLDYRKAASLLFTRGLLMEDSCKSGEGAMLNVIGDFHDSINKFSLFSSKLREEEREMINISSINSKRLIVLSGRTDLIEESMKFYKSYSIACKRLPVSGAFHSKLMSKASLGFESFLFDNKNSIIFKLPQVDILSTIRPRDKDNNHNWKYDRSDKDFDNTVKNKLISQLESQVDLVSCVNANFKTEEEIQIYDIIKRKFVDKNEYLN
jgi:malonyl CoA-acyl carrier protein transacylase